VALYVLALRGEEEVPCGREGLPQSWQSYLETDRPPWRKERSQRGYALLAAALRQLQPERALPELMLSSAGKPGFAGDCGWHFSLSHTDGLTALALSNSPVGIDSEKLRAAPQRLCKRFQSASEEAFWRDWTSREALGKLRGDGVAGLIREAPATLPGEYLYPITALSGYALCVACGGEEKPLFYPAAKLRELQYIK